MVWKIMAIQGQLYEHESALLHCPCGKRFFTVFFWCHFMLKILTALLLSAISIGAFRFAYNTHHDFVRMFQ